MKLYKIYEYAYMHALEVWAYEKTISDENPEDENAKYRTMKRWEDVNELAKLIAECEAEIEKGR